MCCSLSIFLSLRDHYDAVSVTNTEDVEILLPHIRVDLILADVDTPRGDIIKTLSWVKKHFAEIPIVMIYLNFRDGEMEKKAFEMTDACLHKPLEHDELIEVIGRKLKKVSNASS